MPLVDSVQVFLSPLLLGLGTSLGSFCAKHGGVGRLGQLTAWCLVDPAIQLCQSFCTLDLLGKDSIFLRMTSYARNLPELEKIEAYLFPKELRYRKGMIKTIRKIIQTSKLVAETFEIQAHPMPVLQTLRRLGVSWPCDGTPTPYLGTDWLGVWVLNTSGVQPLQPT